MDNGDGILGAVCSAETTAFTQGFEHIGSIIHQLYGTIGAILDADTTVITGIQVNISHDSFCLKVSHFHRDRRPHRCRHGLFTGIFQVLGRPGTSTKIETIAGEIRWAELDMSFLEKSIRVSGHLELTLKLVYSAVSFKSGG